jgi:hypothetical protein
MDAIKGGLSRSDRRPAIFGTKVSASSLVFCSRIDSRKQEKLEQRLSYAGFMDRQSNEGASFHSQVHDCHATTINGKSAFAV